MQTTLLVAQESVDMKDVGVASSTAILVRTIGSSFGVSLMGTLFSRRVQGAMVEDGRVAVSVIAFVMAWFVKEVPLRGELKP